MKTSLLKIIALALFIAASAFSCEWLMDDGIYKPDCASGDCVTLKINGSVREMPSGEGLPNVPVNVSFITGWLSANSIKVGTGRTDRNGEFDFLVKINRNDASSLRVSIPVSIPEQKNYINSSSNELLWLWKKYMETQSNIHFEFYNKASLTINLNRTQNDEFDWFNLGHFSAHNINPRWLLSGAAPETNTAIQVETAADVYTKIILRKRLNPETMSEFADSLICRQNVNNVININY